MIIDLSEVFSDANKTLEINNNIESEEFSCSIGNYKYVGDNNSYSFVFSNIGKKSILMRGSIVACLAIPCDRCLEPVNTDFDISISKEINLNNVNLNDNEEVVEWSVYIDGTDFDAEAFVNNEILVNLPMKVLCKPDCKGICNRCGTNLNYESCDCDTKELDPRMSKVLEVFKQFKEV